MKIISSVLTLLVLTFSTFAHAGLVAKGCFQEQDKKYGPYVVEVSIFSDAVTVSYTSSKHGGLGGYRGRIYSSSDIKKTSQSVSVDNITLNDGADGFIDEVKIKITKNTVTFDSKNSRVGAKPQVRCLR